MPPEPPRKLTPSVLEKQAAANFPSWDVYFKTYWQPWYLQVNTLSEWIIGIYLHKFTNNQLEISMLKFQVHC